MKRKEINKFDDVIAIITESIKGKNPKEIAKEAGIAWNTLKRWINYSFKSSASLQKIINLLDVLDMKIVINNHIEIDSADAAVSYIEQQIGEKEFLIKELNYTIGVTYKYIPEIKEKRGMGIDNFLKILQFFGDKIELVQG